MPVKHFPGKNIGKIMLYALSTCVWCKKTKQLLSDLGVAYDCVDVDTLKGDEEIDTLKNLALWNKSGSFPTMVIGDKKCIIGFKEDEIREALNL